MIWRGLYDYYWSWARRCNGETLSLYALCAPGSGFMTVSGGLKSMRSFFFGWPRAFRRAHAVQRSCGRGVVSPSMTVVQFLHPLLHPRAGITPPSQFGGARATGYTNTTAKVQRTSYRTLGRKHGPLGDVLTSDNCTVLQTAHGFNNCHNVRQMHRFTNGTRSYKWHTVLQVAR